MADITPIVSLNGELAMPEKVWMQGPQGAAATVTVGTVTTGEPGTDAIVTNSGTENAAVLDFTIPKGDTGATGPAGADGVSPTVSTSKSGNVTTITIVDAAGTKTATINDGAKGDTGPAGPAGAGVPDGGTVGQLLSKTETGTAWIYPPQSGVSPEEVAAIVKEQFPQIKEQFAVTFSSADMQNWTCDKTLAEITEAINSGREVVGSLMGLLNVDFIEKKPNGAVSFGKVLPDTAMLRSYYVVVFENKVEVFMASIEMTVTGG